jgi:hypothetical protein
VSEVVESAFGFAEIAVVSFADLYGGKIVAEGVRLLELAHSAQRLFAKQEPSEQRRMLNFVLSNSIWKNDELFVTFHQPFDLVAKTAMSGPSDGAAGGGNPPSRPDWWAVTDSNRRPSRCKRDALPTELTALRGGFSKIYRVGQSLGPRASRPLPPTRAGSPF